MSYHEVWVEDDGELVDVVPYCSDACARDDEHYAGWSGCHEAESRTYCQGCGVIIGGFDEPCDCCYPVVVNLIGMPEDEVCEHGQLVRAAV